MARRRKNYSVTHVERVLRRYDVAAYTPEDAMDAVDGLSPADGEESDPDITDVWVEDEEVLPVIRVQRLVSSKGHGGYDYYHWGLFEATWDGTQWKWHKVAKSKDFSSDKLGKHKWPNARTVDKDEVMHGMPIAWTKLTEMEQLELAAHWAAMEKEQDDAEERRPEL